MFKMPIEFNFKKTIKSVPYTSNIKNPKCITQLCHINNNMMFENNNNKQIKKRLVKNHTLSSDKQNFFERNLLMHFKNLSNNSINSG